MRRGYRKWTAEEAEYVASHYADGDTKDIARALGRSIKSIQYFAYRNGLARNRELAVEHFAKTMNDRTSEERADWKAKCGASMRKLWQSERRRLIFGLPQRTKLRVTTISARAKRRYISKVAKKYSYSRFQDEPSALFYDLATRRKERVEAFAKAKYGINFLPKESYKSGNYGRTGEDMD